jgi:hypothetical protein
MTHAYLKAKSMAPDQFCGKVSFPTRQAARLAASRTVPPKVAIKSSTHPLEPSARISVAPAGFTTSGMLSRGE